MANLVDYLAWRGDLTLHQSPWCDVDSLAMACLSYVKLQEAAEEPVELRAMQEPDEFDDQLINRFFARCRSLFDDMASSRRFGSMVLHDYVDIIDETGVMQFSAVTADLPDGTCFIAFRGTDSTLVGWREDFRMAYESPVPAQEEAVRYLLRMAQACVGKLRLGGHSKGGNLAVYAAAYVPEDIQQRILSVSSFDGPGLDDATIASEDYARIRPLITSVIPQSSVVGLLLGYHPEYTVVKSNTLGLLQHDAFTWEVLGAHFVEMEDVDAGSSLLAETLHEWLQECTPEERKRLVDAVFDVLASSNAKSFSEMSEEKLRSMSAILTASIGMDPKKVFLFLRLLHSFLRIGAGNVIERLTEPDTLE